MAWPGLGYYGLGVPGLMCFAGVICRLSGYPGFVGTKRFFSQVFIPTPVFLGPPTAVSSTLHYPIHHFRERFFYRLRKWVITS